VGYFRVAAAAAGVLYDGGAFDESEYGMERDVTVVLHDLQQGIHVYAVNQGRNAGGT
jgi:hypothetical protein